MAVRLALGVSRARLMGQLLIESMVLAIASSAVAVVLAQLTGGALRVQLSSFRWTATVVDSRVMTLSLAIGMVGGIVAGTLPGLFLLRTDISRALRAGGAGATRTKSKLPTVLLAIQVASCTALLACGGAFLESFRHAGTYDRGFESHRLLQVSVPAYGSTGESEAEDIERRLRSMPDVESVGRSVSPLNATTYATKVGPTYRDTLGVGPRGPSAEFVERDFMSAVGLRIVAGRVFTADDELQPTTVLTESLAAALFPDGRAIGACVHIREPGSPCRTVVGIVRDVRWDVSEPPIYRIYIPLTQAFQKTNSALVPITLYVRIAKLTSTDDIRRIHGGIDRLAPGRQLTVQRVDSLLEPLARPWRLAATLALILGLLGLTAATTGIYGLVALDVAERSREFGIRLALGATSGSILRLVLSSGLRVAAIGGGVGAVAAALMGFVIASLLFDSAPWDPVVLLITATVLTAAALAASAIPAWRAVHGDPVRALASE
jgi:predicted permease